MSVRVCVGVYLFPWQHTRPLVLLRSPAAVGFLRPFLLFQILQQLEIVLDPQRMSVTHKVITLSLFRLLSAFHTFSL